MNVRNVMLSIDCTAFISRYSTEWKHFLMKQVSLVFRGNAIWQVYQTLLLLLFQCPHSLNITFALIQKIFLVEKESSNVIVQYL